MDKFSTFTATACPINVANLNTDQIIPARFLKRPRASGFGIGLFHDLRHDAQGKEWPDFPLNRPLWRNANIIVAGRNFGCGSSREGAVYALADCGIRCVIAPSFGDIFSSNSAQNGLLTAIVSEQDAADIAAALTNTPGLALTVDLEQQTILCGNRSYPFTLDPVRRQRLLEGWDDLALTQSYRDRIASFKAADRGKWPWAAPPADLQSN
jgi:3-isopropylmalate/(R)-2-methylmalate dehydratase small subunit